MLTNNKLDNLLSYYILFFNDKDNDIIASHHTYIAQKFDIFFYESPNKIKNIPKEYWDNLDVFNLSNKYLTKWGLDINKFMNHPNFPKWYFTFYLIHSTKEKRKNDKYGIFSKILLIYNKFFTDYNFISEDDQINVLHILMRQFHNKIKEEHLMIYRTALINKMIK